MAEVRLFTRRKVVLLLMIFAVSSGFAVWRYNVRKNAERVIHECAVAGKVLQGGQPDFEQAQAFIHRLRAIDMRGAPQDLADAVHGYADALDNDIAAARKGEKTAVLDAKLRDAKAKLQVVTKHYLKPGIF